MRHRRKSERFSRSRAQRKALINSLLRALIINERISTTTSKAKYLRSWMDKLIAWTKNDCLAHRRLAYRILSDHNLVKRLFEVIGPRFKNINGGYTRVLKLGFRPGDGASVSLLEFTKVEKKEKIHKEKKEKTKEDVTEKHEEKIVPKKTEKPKKGIMSGVKKIFKKERDSL
jgi:large subunit ribosomal protein L17